MTAKPEKDIKPTISNKKGLCRCPGAGYYSDLMLEAMQTSAIFFNNDGTIYRSNTLARKDLHLNDDIVGLILSDLLSIICQEEQMLPSLLASLDETGNDQVQLPDGAVLRCNTTNVQFFASGCITRLECGRHLLSFRNIMDEVTRERILNMILARTKIFPWFYDTDHNKMLIDVHWFIYLGIPAGDCMITQEEFFARVHPDDRAMLSEALRLHLYEQEICEVFNYRLMRGDGTWEWFTEQAMYLSRTVDGSPYRVVGVCQSIQDHKTTEENLRKARDKAQESDRLKSAFLANMSHEIRTPLNAIVGFSNLLTSGEIDPRTEEAMEYAALISKNCDYLITLVTDILDLSRIETGAMDYIFSEHSLSETLLEIYEKFRHRVPKDVSFKLLLPPEDIRIETDALRLRQVMENLVGNAIKFTTRGCIDFGCSPSGDGKSVRLFVSDTGCGIPSDKLDKIFDRFYKINSFKQGAGLGLAVCKTIIEGIGGQLTVSSQLEKGSRFTIKIPIKRQK